MNPLPRIDTEFSTLPDDASARHEALVNFFGQHVFWCRSQTLDFARRAVTSCDLRQRLGRIQAEPFACIYSLPESAQSAALDFARASVDHFAQLFLALLTTMSADQRLGQDHAIRYKLIMEIIEQHDWDHIVHEEMINRDGQKAFFAYFGRWLRHHHESTPSA